MLSGLKSVAWKYFYAKVTNNKLFNIAFFVQLGGQSKYKNYLITKE